MIASRFPTWRRCTLCSAGHLVEDPPLFFVCPRCAQAGDPGYRPETRALRPNESPLPALPTLRRAA